jgi:4-carboxymuconolactone decarboxylase
MVEGMFRITTLLTVLVVVASSTAAAQSNTPPTLAISRGGSRAIERGREATFTGDVRIEMLYDAVDPSHASGGFVTFSPGARTAWHSHPGGQILIVTAGTGRVQLWGQPIEEINTGDVVRIASGVKHWHGAAPRTSMTHLGITERRDGTGVQWMEKVSEEQYHGDTANAAQPPPANPPQATGRPSGELQQRLAPGLATLTDDVLYGDVWMRPELSPRDRSLVTVSVLIATGKTAQLGGHLGRALTNGVTPSEASALLAHLAIYCGWPSAVSALEVYEQVYTARKVDTSTLGAASTRRPVPASELARAGATPVELRTAAPKFVQLTNDVVFDDLWRRTDLGVRDRSLVTITALAAMGDDDQLDRYLRLGVESGLTRAQIAEALTHLGFYAGWPKATKALMAAAPTLNK